MSQMQIDVLLSEMVRRKASDIYLTHQCTPALRIADAILPFGDKVLDDADLEALFLQITTDVQRDEFMSTLEMNSAVSWQDASRFRVNVMRQQGHLAIVIRRIQMEIPSLDELQLPKMYSDLVMMKRGLILIVGPTGSGKTTSLAAMVGHRNKFGSGHIITVEDPIEFVHKHDQCIISQRDVGLDTYSYTIALKNALRQRPDMVVIGEIRDREVMEQAIHFAETGHLCLATLHANNASQAIERVLNFFPEERHPQILLNLGLNLRAVLSQRLVRNLRGSRTLALELMLNNGLIRQLIEENKIRHIREMIEKGSLEGMQTFDQHLYTLLREQIISEEVALAEADNPSNLRLKLTNERNATRISHEMMVKKSEEKTLRVSPAKPEGSSF